MTYVEDKLWKSNIYKVFKKGAQIESSIYLRLAQGIIFQKQNSTTEVFEWWSNLGYTLGTPHNLNTQLNAYAQKTVAAPHGLCFGGSAVFW